MKLLIKTRFWLLFLTISVITACNKSNSNFSPSLIPFKLGEKWGYANSDGKYEINPQFSYADYFVDDLALVSSSDKFGFIDQQGKYVINPQFKDASNFSEGLACVVPENGKIKYIDKTGQYKFELPNAEFAGDFHSGLARVKISNKWGFIDNTGKIVINPQFDNVLDFTEDMAAIMNKNEKGEKLFGFIDKTGKIIINCQFQSVEPFKEGLAAVTIDGNQFGFIDKTGKFVINAQYKMVNSFVNGIATIEIGSEWGIINKEGKVIVNPQFTDIILPSVNNLIAVKSDNKWGYVNSEGKFEINPQFDTASNFIGDIAIVGVSHKIGFIDRKGKYTATPQFDDFVSPFRFSNYGMGYTFSLIESDFFDVALFTDKMLADNKFLALDSNTTVANLTSLYNLTLNNFSNKGKIEIKEENDLVDEFNTRDIHLDNITIDFKGDAYHTDDKYENYTDYWGTTRQRVVSSTKVLNTDTKLYDIDAVISLINNGKDKGKSVAEGIKNIMLKKYNLQELTAKKLDDEKVYVLIQSDDKYFVYIRYNDNSIGVYISYEIENNKGLKEKVKSIIAS